MQGYAYQSGEFVDPYLATEEGEGVCAYVYGVGGRDETVRRDAPVEVDAGAGRSWCRESNLLVSKLQNPELSSSERSNVCGELAALFNDFAFVSTHVSRTIIDELRLPQEQKSVKSVDVGGLAGGTKFLHNNILFKLPQDPLMQDKVTYLFGGAAPCSYLASKSAGREMTSFDALAIELIGDGERFSSTLNTPMCCLVDYRGYRVFAIMVVPISKERDTLVLGSADGGISVYNRDHVLAEEMRRVAKALHLAPHQVQGTTVFGGGDVEIHRGLDGKGYVVDLARLLPPTAPVPGQLKSKVFCELFRPELLKRLKSEDFAALSSDTFAGWGMSDPLRRQRENDVRVATKHLFDVVIPEVAKFLCTAEAVFEFPLSKVLHQHGVNIRYLDRIYMCMEGAHAQSWKVVLGTEMYARVFKRELRALLRASSGESESRRIVANFLTQVRTSYEFWRDRAPALLASEPLWEKCKPSYDLPFLCMRVVNMLGVQVARIEPLNGPVHGEAPFFSFDLPMVLAVDIERWDPIVHESGDGLPILLQILDKKNLQGIAKWMAGLSLFNYARGLLASHVQRESALSSLKEAFKLLRECAVRLRSVFPARHALVVLSYLLSGQVLASDDVWLLMELAGVESEPAFGMYIASVCFNAKLFPFHLHSWSDRVKNCVDTCGAVALREFKSRFFSEIRDPAFEFMWEFLVAYYTDDWSSDELLRLIMASANICAAEGIGFFVKCLNMTEREPLAVAGAVLRKVMRGRTSLPVGFRPEHNVLLGHSEGILPVLDVEEWPPSFVTYGSFRTQKNIYAWMDGLELTLLKRLRVEPRCLSDFDFARVRAPNLEKLTVVTGAVQEISGANIIRSAGAAFKSIRFLELLGGQWGSELETLLHVPALQELHLHNAEVEFEPLQALLELGRLVVLGLTNCKVASPQVANLTCDAGHVVDLKIPYMEMRGDWSCDVCSAERAWKEKSYHCDTCGWDLCPNCGWNRSLGEVEKPEAEKCSLGSLILRDVDAFEKFLPRVLGYLASEIRVLELSGFSSSALACVNTNTVARVREKFCCKAKKETIEPPFEHLSKCQEISVSCDALPASLDACKSLQVREFNMSEEEGAALLPSLTKLDARFGEKGRVPKSVRHLVVRSSTSGVAALSCLQQESSVARLSLCDPSLQAVQAITGSVSIRVLELVVSHDLGAKKLFPRGVLPLESLANLHVLRLSHIRLDVEGFAGLMCLPNLRVLKVAQIGPAGSFGILNVLQKLGVCHLRLLSVAPFIYSQKDVDAARAAMAKYQRLIVDGIAPPEDVEAVLQEFDVSDL